MKIQRILAVAITALMMMTACTDSQRGRAPRKTPESSVVSAQSVISGLSPSSSAASEDISEEDDSSDSSELPAVFDSPICSSSILYCADDHQVLYQDSTDMKTPPASITKLLTASVVLKNMSPDDIVEVGSEQNLVHEDSSRCYISIGNRLTVRDLLTGMLLCSGNDAAYTAAVTTARAVHPDRNLSDQEAVETFVAMMNETAAEIGMANSHFSTPDGWDDDDQYVTASDLVALAEYTLAVPEIRTIVGTAQKDVVFASGESASWTNTNYLLDPESLYYCKEAIGMKTGTTDYAGYCLLSAFKKNGKTYIIAVLGCQRNDDRYGLTLKIFGLAK